MDDAKRTAHKVAEPTQLTLAPGDGAFVARANGALELYVGTEENQHVPTIMMYIVAMTSSDDPRMQAVYETLDAVCKDLLAKPTEEKPA